MKQNTHPNKKTNNYEVVADPVKAFVLVELTRGKWAVCDVDDWFGFLIGHKWHAMKSKNTFYAASKTFDIGTGRVSTPLMHRMVFGSDPGSMVDHKNGDGLNNLRTNLRIANHSQNAMNSKMNKANTSGCKGVNWDEFTKMWLVRIAINKKPENLGRYHNFDEAVAVRKNAERLHYGEFAR
jgi:hypothetical protein